MRTHIVSAVTSGCIAVSVTIVANFYGAHDLGGFFAVTIGLPGFLVAIQGDHLKLNALIVTIVNWLFYFALFEAVLSITRKVSTRRKLQDVP